MKIFNKIISVGVALLLLLNTINVSATIGKEYEKNADVLFELGLFLGTDYGYELERVSTRAEAAVMLVRLLGEEKKARLIGKSKEHPFKDVDEWANPYVSYLYKNGLTQGIASDLYGSNKAITGNEYTTMLLRALGYDDKLGTYSWENAMSYSVGVGLLNSNDFNKLKNSENSPLSRDHLVKLSYNTLFTKNKGTNILLGSKLYNNGVFNKTQLLKAANINKEVLNLSSENINIEPVKSKEYRGIWISYLDMMTLLKTGNQQDFTRAVEEMYRNIKDLGLNTVIVQVRPFADSIYPSKYFPWTYLISGTEGIAPSYDPFQIMVSKAHEMDLKIEAWINPYRIRPRNSKIELSSNNIAKTWLNDGSRRVLSIDEGLYYNPANEDVKKLIINGVMEIIDKYKVDGIHFDDYFYPTTSPDFDKIEYNAYLNNGGNLSLANWRRENVNDLVQRVYKSIKSKNKNIVFGISPVGSISNNYDVQYSDVAKWSSTSGFVDYITPQIYYGYNNSTMPYLRTLAQWNELVSSNKVNLYIGLAAYKIGVEDRWAGDGKNEWIESRNLIKRMIEDGRKQSNYKGFTLFRYEHIFNPNIAVRTIMQLERNAVKEFLNK